MTSRLTYAAKLTRRYFHAPRADQLGHAEVQDFHPPIAGDEEDLGFRSRWTIPRACAAARPRATCTAQSIA